MLATDRSFPGFGGRPTAGPGTAGLHMVLRVRTIRERREVLTQLKPPRIRAAWWASERAVHAPTKAMVEVPSSSIVTVGQLS